MRPKQYTLEAVQGDEKEEVPTWALKPVLITAKRERYTASSGSAAIFGRL